jgi:hypothetical protein
MAATRTARAFNGGYSSLPDSPPGIRRELHERPVVERCATPRCGMDDDESITVPRKGQPFADVPRGWTYVLTQDSTERGRWYCSPACVTRGVALAQLRMKSEP